MSEDRDTIKVSRAVIIEFLERIGLNADNVSSLSLKPTSGTVRVYRLNENGAKYVDEKSGRAALDTVLLKVTA